MKIAATPPVPPVATAEIRRAAEGFEAIFLATLLKGARAGLPGDSLTGSAGLKSAQDMLDGQLARVAGSHAGLGIAEAVARQFTPPETGT